MNEELIKNDLDLDEIFETDYKPILKTVASSKEILEDIVVQTIIDLLKNTDKPDIKLKTLQLAVSLLNLEAEVARLSKLEDKAPSMAGGNANISSALIKSLSGISTVTSGSANEIKTQKGGKGA